MFNWIYSAGSIRPVDSLYDDYNQKVININNVAYLD